MGKVLLTLLLACALFAGPLSAQKYDFNPGCQQAWNSVIMFRFDEARQLIRKEQAFDPGNLMPVYIENYIDFLTLFTGEEKAWFDQVRNNKEIRLDKLSKGDKSSPMYRFCLADVYMQWAFSRLKFREYTAAGLELRKANELLRENHALFPDFLPDQLGLGTMHAISGLIPENYRWLANMIGFEGDLDQGQGEMKKVLDYSGGDPFIRSLKIPACLFAAMINATLRNDRNAALAIVSRFNSDPDLLPYSDSPLVLYAKSTIYLKTGHSDQVLTVLSGRSLPKGTFRLCFLDYLEGLARLNHLDPAAANSFKSFISGFRGGNYIKSSWQKIAWASLIRGDTTSYRTYIRMALTQGNGDVDEDKQAFIEAENGIIPNVTLLKARLLTDGGFYTRALEVLLHQSLKHYIRDRQELAEYNYRLGRIYQATDQEAKALSHYALAVQNGKELPQYFAGGAALQMGIIHEQHRRFGQADSCFRLCLSLSFKEYKTSLSQKARAGLNRVKKRTR